MTRRPVYEFLPRPDINRLLTDTEISGHPNRTSGSDHIQHVATELRGMLHSGAAAEQRILPTDSTLPPGEVSRPRRPVPCKTSTTRPAL